MLKLAIHFQTKLAQRNDEGGVNVEYIGLVLVVMAIGAGVAEAMGGYVTTLVGSLPTTLQGG